MYGVGVVRHMDAVGALCDAPNATPEQKSKKQGKEIRMDVSTEKESASTTTRSKRKNDQSVLTQEELARWWPFTRLDPKRFPKEKKYDPLADVGEALM